MIQHLPGRKVSKQVLQTLLLLFLTSLLVLNINNQLVDVRKLEQGDKQRDGLTFSLEHCNCSRTLTKVDNSGLVPYNATTCGRDAHQRGAHQKVAGFSFYGSSTSKVHQMKKYFVGIKENLEKMTELYGEDWVMRLYYDLEPSDQQLMGQLCDLACANSNIDLCNIRQLPGTPVRDATEIFAMNWRFFPTLDPQVDIYLCRDLDSRVSEREVAAVEEWLGSGRAVHSMRDHPAHNTPLLGASWGARLDTEQQNVRHKWVRAWDKILADKLAWAARGAKGPDQTVLQRHVWPWARFVAMQHDSYTCHTYPHTIGWPTRRRNEPNNFVASVFSDNATLWTKCPKKCRRKGHMDWNYC